MPTKKTFFQFNIPETRKLYLIMIIAILIIPITASSVSKNYFSPYIETFPQGRIDWKNGLIYGIGRGYIDKNVTDIRAITVARLIASGNILKLAAGLRLDDRRVMASLGKGRVTIKLKAFLKIQKEEKKLINNAKRPYYEIIRIASIKGVEGLTAKLISEFKSKPVDWIPPPLPPGTTSDIDNNKDMPWLVLDARKLANRDPVKPAIFPKIVTSMGETVYSLPQVDEAALIKRGMASYVTTDKTVRQIQSQNQQIAEVLKDLKEFLSPVQAYADDENRKKRKLQKFIVKKVKAAEGLLNTNLVISAKDAKELKNENVSSQILKNCRVIVVVSSQISGIEGELFKEKSNNFFARN